MSVLSVAMALVGTALLVSKKKLLTLDRRNWLTTPQLLVSISVCVDDAILLFLCVETTLQDSNSNSNSMGFLNVLRKVKQREREMRIILLGLDNAGAFQTSCHKQAHTNTAQMGGGREQAKQPL